MSAIPAKDFYLLKNKQLIALFVLAGPVPKPMTAPAPVKLTTPLLKAYNPITPPTGCAPPQQSHTAETGLSNSLPDILQHLMPNPGA